MAKVSRTLNSLLDEVADDNVTVVLEFGGELTVDVPEIRMGSAWVA
jgi:hypothetical protein